MKKTQKTRKIKTAPAEKTGDAMIRDYRLIEAAFMRHLDGYLSAIEALGQISSILRSK
jgi:hypothetical protein